MTNEAARQREGELNDEVTEEYEALLEDAISRLNAVYVLITKEHGIESVHWTRQGADKAADELRKFAAYRSAQFRFLKVQVVK